MFFPRKFYINLIFTMWHMAAGINTDSSRANWKSTKNNWFILQAGRSQSQPNPNQDFSYLAYNDSAMFQYSEASNSLEIKDVEPYVLAIGKLRDRSQRVTPKPFTRRTDQRRRRVEVSDKGEEKVKLAKAIKMEGDQLTLPGNSINEIMVSLTQALAKLRNFCDLVKDVLTEDVDDHKDDGKIKSSSTSTVAAPGAADAATTVTASSRKIKVKRIKKKFKKFLWPLLIAYKLKFFTLVPVLVGGLTLLVGTTGLAGFFFALFTAGMSLKSPSAKRLIVKHI